MQIIRKVEPSNEAQATAMRFFDTIGNLGEMRKLFSEDVVWTIWGDLPFSGTHSGLQAVLDDFHGPAGALFDPDFEGAITVTGVYGKGPTVAIEFNNKSRMRTGKEYHNFYVAVFEIRGSQISVVREYCDTAHLRATGYAEAS